MSSDIASKHTISTIYMDKKDPLQNDHSKRKRSASTDIIDKCLTTGKRSVETWCGAQESVLALLASRVF